MPTYAGLIERGVRGDNGLVQAFPPNTGVGWYTLATGTYPGEHGAAPTTPSSAQGMFSQPHVSLLGTASYKPIPFCKQPERAGKTVVSVEWAGARNLVPAHGPVVDFRTFLFQPRHPAQLGSARSTGWR